MAVGVDEFGRPTWLPSEEEFRTPEEEFARFTAGQKPFWSVRAPMRDVGERLRARYLLAAPEMGELGTTPTFGQFLRDYPGTMAAQPNVPSYMAWPGAEATPEGYAPLSLRERAQEAALAATTPQGEYLSKYAPETRDWNRRAWMAQEFGPEGEESMRNQLRVAQMLATQRPTTGEAAPRYYQGGMGEAIRNAVSRMYQQRVYGDEGAPRETFLDWYLGQTAPPATT